jgi:hypothetical protein
MDNFEATVGFPNENYEITYVPGKIYGLAYINQLTPGWICNAGVLPYLFGCYQSFIALNAMLPEDPNDYFGTVFFEINKDLEPILVITSINTTKAFEVETTGMKNGFNIIIRDLSILDGDNIPKLEFEI